MCCVRAASICDEGQLLNQPLYLSYLPLILSLIEVEPPPVIDDLALGGHFHDRQRDRGMVAAPHNFSDAFGVESVVDRGHRLFRIGRRVDPDILDVAQLAIDQDRQRAGGARILERHGRTVLDLLAIAGRGAGERAQPDLDRRPRLLRPCSEGHESEPGGSDQPEGPENLRRVPRRP